MKVGNDFGSTSLKPNPSNSVICFSPSSVSRCGTFDSEQECGEHRAISCSRAFSSEEKTDASLNCQSDSRDGSARYFQLTIDFAQEGRKRLRTVAIRAVLSMVNRTNTPLMDFYSRKKREKGSGKAICATARKLLTIIFVMLKKELDYWYLEDRLYNRKLRQLNAAA